MKRISNREGGYQEALTIFVVIFNTGIAFYRCNFLKVSIQVHHCHFLEQMTENTFTVPKNNYAEITKLPTIIFGVQLMQKKVLAFQKDSKYCGIVPFDCNVFIGLVQLHYDDRCLYVLF